MGKQTSFVGKSKPVEQVPIFTLPSTYRVEKHGKKQVHRVACPPLEPIPEPSKDWRPKSGHSVHFVHEGGSVREYTLSEYEHPNKWAVRFAGDTVTLSLKTGRLLAEGKPVRTDWRLYEPELKALRQEVLTRKKEAKERAVKR